MPAPKLIPYDPMLKELARRLRKESTFAEVLLWKRIRGKALGVEFHRQVPLDQFIVDFYCHELMLAIEIDGGSHDDTKAYQKDVARQQRLEGFGVQFIRFTEHQVRHGREIVMQELEGYINALIGRNE